MQMRFIAIQTLLNFGLMTVNSGHHSGHNLRTRRSGDDMGETLTLTRQVEFSNPNQSSGIFLNLTN